ncbi:MAG TPA: amidohydrolase [Myxococcales bacterium]|nr:amidohydrolase [Myxococcales bacterium]HIL80433.1 amidohydrolase [Myxococcales bacterium]
MAHDLVIRGGLLVDGIGGEPTPGDLAVDGDKITAVGEVANEGRREIDARGHLVTPGFVDIHTHLDAQVSWDPLLTPISWHGVTSALIGNCGVTFAPVRPGDSKLLAGMMETVEDIPRELILDQMSWKWEGYGSYLDSLEALNPAINLGGLVGHCAVRFYVMGERAVDGQPSDAEAGAMADVVGQAIADGAIGFSTSRIRGHVMPDGRDVPGTHAKPEELLRIAEAVVANGGGLMQNVLNLSGDFDGEMALIRKLAEATGDRVLFSLTGGRGDASGDRLNGLIDEMGEGGLDVNAVAIPRGSGFIMGLCNILPWRGVAWRKLKKMDFTARLKALDDVGFCQELIDDAKAKPANFQLTDLFPLGVDKPVYDFEPDDSLAAVADRRDEHPAETFLRMSRESRGRALFTFRMFNPNTRALADLISGEHVFPGLGDAGAHVGQIMDSGWCSYVLSHWTRDKGLFSVGEAVRRMTSAPARIMGVGDRGRLVVGLRADLNVIDFEKVAERMPEFVYDFPGGHGRFIQRADGYRATICNGEVILENDEHTGARGGRILRNQH